LGFDAPPIGTLLPRYGWSSLFYVHDGTNRFVMFDLNSELQSPDPIQTSVERIFLLPKSVGGARRVIWLPARNHLAKVNLSSWFDHDELEHAVEDE
jgi:hypothetical protein